MNRMCRLPVATSSSMTSVPTMSDGIRSGVNWMRLNLRLIASASVLISSVLARPGTPRSRQWPPARMQIEHFIEHAGLPDDDAAHFGAQAHERPRDVVERVPAGTGSGVIRSCRHARIPEPERIVSNGARTTRRTYLDGSSPANL